MSGWFPVPHQIIDTLPPSEWPVALYLYQRANRVRYLPFRLDGVRALSARVGCSVSTVRSALHTLEQLGVLTVEVQQTGRRADHRIATLVEPEGSAPNVRGSAAQLANTRTRTRTPPGQPSLFYGVSGSADPKSKHDCAHGSAESAPAPPDLGAPLTKQETSNTSMYVSTQSAVEAVAQVMAVLQEHAPRRRKPPRGLKARLGEHGAEACVLVVRWLFTAAHPRAEYLREHGHTGDTPWRPSKFGTYLAMAREWEAAGAPTPGNGGGFASGFDDWLNVHEEAEHGEQEGDRDGAGYAGGSWGEATLDG